MKKFLLLSLIGGSLLMTSCETTREISLNRDNSGTLTTTTDMSGLIGMAKMSGQNKEMDKLDEVIDTTVSLANMADSLTDLNDEEKAIMKKGKVGLQMNFPDSKLIIKIEFPFSDPSQISRLTELSSTVIAQTIKKQMASTGSDSALSGLPMSDMPQGSIEDYFITTYSRGVIEKKFNREKYTNEENGATMKSLKEMSEMGVGNSTLIINLPVPAKKAEGKNVKLSDDKKKVLIINSAEDFFDDPTTLEFRIEY